MECVHFQQLMIRHISVPKCLVLHASMADKGAPNEGREYQPTNENQQSVKMTRTEILTIRYLYALLISYLLLPEPI